MVKIAALNQAPGSWLDPRPDLESDAWLWAAVLLEAQRSDAHPDNPRSLFGLLHGLRCGGARLSITGAKTIRLEYSALVTSGLWTNKELRQEWLMPAAAAIKAVFNKVERHIATYENQATLFPAAAGL